jgi:nitroreductase
MDRDERLDWLLARRSATVLAEPGPTPDELAKILAAAGTVPDHGELRPFRLAVLSGDGRAAFGNALAESARERAPTLAEAALVKIREKAQRSPTIVAVIASPKPGKIEVWEQVATAACAGYAVILAAYALGVGAVWKSVPFTRGAGLVALFGLAPTEEVIGWIHLGTSVKPITKARAPLDLGSIVTVFDGSAPRPFGT